MAVPSGAASPAPVVPAQFLARLYTEALGRAPTPWEWERDLGRLRGSRCSADALRELVRSFYLSPAFEALGYEDPERLLALFRGALGQEPEEEPLAELLARRRAGAAWDDVVDELLGDARFQDVAACACGSDPSCYFGESPAIDLPGPGQAPLECEVQARLWDAPRGGTIYLPPRAVVRIAGAVVVPADVTLATAGEPGLRHYARMARLVRDGGLNAPLVTLMPGAKLRAVWVDGQRGEPDAFRQYASNVEMRGGLGATVEGCRLDGSQGAATLLARGEDDGTPCDLQVISGNLITAYGSSHYGGSRPDGRVETRWTDGISIACGGAIVTGNAVVDATDVGIVAFGVPGAGGNLVPGQRSIVANNVVLNAGNSAYAAIAADPLGDRDGCGPRGRSFAGFVATGNVLLTGPRTHFDIGIAVGTAPWFGRAANEGIGATFAHNLLGVAGAPARVDAGVTISGMTDARVEGNAIEAELAKVCACDGGVLVAVSSADASEGTGRPVRRQPAPAGPCVGHGSPYFSAEISAGTAPLSVPFQFVPRHWVRKRERRDPAAFLWDFGDGSTSGAMHPRHTYRRPGRYTVSLWLGRPGGDHGFRTRRGFVTVGPGAPPDARFVSSHLRGSPPTLVTFTDHSRGGVSSWSWDFGDGASSADPNPTHVYRARGTYDVTLTVANAHGGDVVVRRAEVILRD